MAAIILTMIGALSEFDSGSKMDIGTETKVRYILTVNENEVTEITEALRVRSQDSKVAIDSRTRSTRLVEQLSAIPTTGA